MDNKRKSLTEEHDSSTVPNTTSGSVLFKKIGILMVDLRNNFESFQIKVNCILIDTRKKHHFTWHFCLQFL